MKKLQKLLKKKKYQKIRFKVSRTQHLIIKAKINGVRGLFILDTGASSSCVGYESVSFFKLIAGKSQTKAAGAGATGMETHLAVDNNLKIGSWKCTDFQVVIFDLSHVNEALRQHKTKEVRGIIGADVLLHGNAIIDYASNCLFLSKL